MKTHLTVGEAVQTWSVLIAACTMHEHATKRYIAEGCALGADISASRLVSACRVKAMLNEDEWPYAEEEKTSDLTSPFEA